MRRSLIVGVVCALLAATGAAFSQTQTFTNFILSAPNGVPTVSDILACVEGSPAKTNQCSVSSIWAVLRSITNVWSGPQEFNPNAFSLNGSTSGQLVINAPATASGTIVFPAGTTDFSATGGTSQVVKQTSVGGPFTVAQLACSDLSNAGAGCSASSTVSSVTAADSTLTITPTMGAVTAKVATNGVANANLAQMTARTVKCNNTGSTATPTDCAMGVTYQDLTTGTAATYTTPAAATWLRVRECGGGGGGGGVGTSATNGTAGGATSFNSIVTNGGAAGTGQSAGISATGGLGGSAGTGTAAYRVAGQNGGGSVASSGGPTIGGSGGSTAFFGGGAAIVTSTTSGWNGVTNSGGGGGGGAAASVPASASGGGGGECAEFTITGPASTYTYTVGAGGTQGTGGSANGGNGAAGQIVVEEHYD